MKDAVALGADYVDIEARTEKPLLEGTGGTDREVSQPDEMDHLLSRSQRQPLLKGHSKEEFDACSRIGADIVKICHLAHAMEDNLRVLGLIPYARNKGPGHHRLVYGGAG